MPEPPELHADVAAYALDLLAPDERARFEQHLAGCAACQSDLAELLPVAGLLALAAPADVPPAALQARTFMAIERAAAATESADEERAPAPEPPSAMADGARARRRAAAPRRRWLPRLALAGATAVAVAAAAFVGFRVGEERQPGRIELDAVLVSAGRTGSSGTARVTETGIGRIVALESDDLPELDNDREFYEVWFVGPGDSPEAPNRVSAGTFHPDPEGRSSVRLTAAAVPRNYPVLSVTREPRDGDPRPGGREVLRSRS